jgi:hypothetical protein
MWQQNVRGSLQEPESLTTVILPTPFSKNPVDSVIHGPPSNAFTNLPAAAENCRADVQKMVEFAERTSRQVQTFNGLERFSLNK